MTVTYGMENIGPDLAKQLLDNNGANRRIKEASVSRYTRDMTHGQWAFIGDPIRLAKADNHGVERVLDGQNRLQAVINSGTTQPFMVFRGLEDNTQAVMDSGVGRSVQDTLHMAGNHRASQLAASARLIWAIGLGPERFASTKDIATNTEILMLLEKNPLIKESLAQVEGVHSKSGLRYPVATASHYFGMIREPELTQAFFAKLKTGLDFQGGEPVTALRNRIGLKNKRLTSTQQLYLTLRALNATRVDELMDKIWLPRGSKPNGYHILGEVKALTSARAIEIERVEDEADEA